MGIKERIEFVPKFNMEVSVYDPTESDKPINIYTAHQDSVQTLRSSNSRSYILKVKPV